MSLFNKSIFSAEIILRIIFVTVNSGTVIERICKEIRQLTLADKDDNFNSVLERIKRHIRVHRTCCFNTDKEIDDIIELLRKSFLS